MTNPADKLSLLMATPNEEPVSQYKGVVQQTDDSKAYVLIDGGTAVWCDTMDVKALVGDRVRVEVRKHKGTLVANYTHPVTDDAVANAADDKATEALDKVETLEVDALKADSAVIKNLQADTAKVHDLTADQLSAATAYVGELTAGEVTAQSIIADKAKLAQVDTDQLNADHAVIETLDSTYASIGSLNAATARIGDIEADYLKTADMTAEQARVGQLMAGKADVADLTAANARIDSLESTKADISVLESDYITAEAIEATYLHADMSNADVAWIQNGVIKDGSISNAMINSLSANKLTAGTINGETINVTNINADNITAGTINGQRIGEGSLSLDKLSEDVYTEQEVDNKLSAMQAEIDGAIETWTGTDVPTLNNSPASGWTTAAARDTHVGDVYFVVNSQSEQNGYNYRFTKSGNTYSWQLIKDSDVTNALQRLSTAEGKITTFDSDISTLKTDTGTLKTKTESLETRMSDAEDDILDKVDTTTFNEVSDTVDQHSQTITQMSQTLSNKADGSTVTALTTRVSKTEQDITGINTTIGELSTTVESKADSSTVETVSNKLNTVSDTVDGHTQSITSINNTLETKADSSTVNTLTTKVNNVSDTVDGNTQTIGSVQSTQTQMQGKLDKTIVETTQLWYSKSSTDAPSKPTSQVTSTSTAGNAWRTVVPAYNASYPNYFYCYQWKYTDGTYGWSGVTRDIAMGESQERARTAITNAAAADTKAGNAATAAATAQSTAEGAASDASKAKTDAASAVSTANTAASDASTALSTANTAKTNADTAVSTANTAASDASTAKTNAATAVSTANTAKATADKNVKSSLQLWYTKANETAPAKPTSKVTSTSVSGNAWRTVVPTYSASYPYYFYCYQYELADGTYTWSDVVYDRATTENQSNSRSAVSGVSTLTTKTNTISDTVDGHTAQLSSITTTQTTIQGSAVKSTVQLWFTKANTTAPSKPTAHVTTNNASTANAWNLAVPTYNASYPYYYYCYEHQLLNDTYTWSAVTRDMATEESQSTSRSAASAAAAADTKAGNAASAAAAADTKAGNAAAAAATADGKAVSAQNTANKNVRESQQLWYTKANSTAPAKPTSKVTSTATTGGAWTTRVPTYSDSYKHYFYCMQYIAADNTVTWSDVVYDQATTEAQSVARAASADLTEFHQEYATFKQTTQEFESTVGETYVTNQRFDDLEIGGRNLLPYSMPSADNIAKVSTANSYNTFVSEDGYPCYKITGGATNGAQYASNAKFMVKLEADTQYTYSAWVKLTTTASVTSMAFNFGSLGHFTVKNDNSSASDKTHEDVASLRIYSPTTVPIGEWTRIKLTFTTNSLDGSYFGVYPKYNLGTEYTLFIRDEKLEKGNKATDWSPAPEDAESKISSIESRVSNAETSITNNAREIEARAKASDVYTKQESDGLITTEVEARNAAIEASADSITSTVSSTYVKNETFDKMSVGGRNLLTGTDKSTEIVHTVASGATHYTEGVTFTVPRVEGQSEYVLSFDAKSSVANYAAYCYWYSPNTTTKAVASTGYVGTGTDGGCIVAIGTSWARYWVKWTQSDTAGTDKHLIVCRMQQANAGTLTIKAIKLETGNMPTAWSPAPEDVDEAIESIPRMAKINTFSRSFTSEQWRTYGASGHVESWITGSSYDNSHLRVGDRAYLTGVISDQDNGSATIIGEVTSVVPTGSGTTAVLMRSEQLIFGGDVVSAVESRMTKAESSIEQLPNQITAKVSNEYATKDEAQLDHAGSGTSVQVNGAANAALKGLHILGESVQDGTPTPSAPVPIQSVGPINLIINGEDLVASGLGSASGSRAEYRAVNLGRSYMDVPHGTRVTVSFDLYMTVNTANPSILVYNTNKKGPKAFSSIASGAGNAAGITYSFSAAVGDVIDRRISVTGYINDRASGSITAQDNYLEFYSNYGTSNWFSISNLQMEFGDAAHRFVANGGVGLEVCGKNLIPRYGQAHSQTINGITWTVASDGAISAVGTASADSTLSLGSVFYESGKTYTVSGCPTGGGSSTHEIMVQLTSVTTSGGWQHDYGSGATFDGVGEWRAMQLVVRNGKTVNITFRPQLEVGAEATEYEPYNSTMTTVPLNGHELRSLPDGTHDELTVDVDGHVAMTQRVGYLAVNESSSHTTYGAIGSTHWRNNYLLSTDRRAAIRKESLCSMLPWAFDTSTSDHFFISGGNNIATIVAATTESGALSVLSGAEFVYPLETSQTIDLGTIDMPQVKDGDTVEVIAALTPSIDVTWWASAGQAVADAYASLSSAIEVRAESIVSTVSERYATSQEVQAISSQITQTAQGWTAQFNQLTGGADLSMTLAEAFEALGVTSRNLEEIRSFVRITTDSDGDPVLLMGSATSPIMLALSNDSLQFMHGSDPVAYIDVDGGTNEGMLHITRAVVVKELQFGSWKWFERDEVGNLALKWVGDE